MNRIRRSWNAMPSSQRVAIALIPIGILVLLAAQQRIPWFFDL